MSLITRRHFASMLGLVAVNGVLRPDAVAQEAHEALVPQKKPSTAKPGAEPVVELDREHAAPEEIWADLMKGNKRFSSGKVLVRDVVKARANTSSAQHPYVMVLCCADSRLSPELIFDQNIGDLFVVRTVGNIADEIALGSLEYAIEHLGSRMLVVMGHEKCGAVTATLSGEAMPTENLNAIVKKIRPGIDRLKGLVHGDTLVGLAVEANVHHSAADVIEESPIVHHALAAGKLSIVKAVYKIGTGEVFRLDSMENKAAG